MNIQVFIEVIAVVATALAVYLGNDKMLPRR